VKSGGQACMAGYGPSSRDGGRHVCKSETILSFFLAGLHLHTGMSHLDIQNIKFHLV
jgi:hypothetical protein